MGVLILDYPYPNKLRESYKFSSNFLRIISSLFNDTIYIVSDNVNPGGNYPNTIFLSTEVEVHLLREIKPKIVSMCLWILESARVQIKMIKYIIRYRHDYEYVVFFLIHPINELFPLIMVKILGKKGVKVPLSPSPKNSVRLPYVYAIFEHFVFKYMDYFIPEYISTTRYLNEGQLALIRDKLLPPANFFMLEGGYIKSTDLCDRRYDIGYIGGFRKIKGIKNFVEAISLINAEINNINCIIIGDGELKEEISDLMVTPEYYNVKLMDWIPHHLLPEYLNQIKILIIPSFSESGPFIAIEAMACGTIVVSTKVGVVPEIVIEGENGYLLNSNSPRCISDKIISIIKNDYEKLDQVSDAAVESINKRFSQNAHLHNWSMALNLLKKE